MPLWPPESAGARPLSALKAAIEHTLLKPEATRADLERLCDQAQAHGLGGICVPSRDVRTCRARLTAGPVRLVTVVGFPTGGQRTEVKVREAELAVSDGADELDMVVDLRALKDGDDGRVVEDIAAVVACAAPRPVKVIVETCVLDEAEKRRACAAIARAGAHFVKTSTGTGTAGATLADVRLLREAAPPGLQIKASGGIRDAASALALLDAGASRIGTSRGDAIVAEHARRPGTS